MSSHESGRTLQVEPELTVESEDQLIEQVLASAKMSCYADALATFGLDSYSIAQAEDEDWETFDIPLEDGLLIQRAMRNKLGLQATSKELGELAY